MADDIFGVDYKNASAEDIIKDILRPYGLEGLGPQMYQVGKTTGDASAAYLWLRQQPDYKQAFPGMDIRAKNKYSPMNEQQYMEWTTTMKSTMENNGIPAGFYDSPDDFAQLIGKNISPQEVEWRVLQGVNAAKNAPQQVKDSLFNYYGIDEGHLASYYLDPTRSKDILMQQAATAQIGAAGMKQGFGALTRDESERLQKAVSTEDANARLGTLGQAQELLGDLPGESGGAISREQQLQFVEGAGPAEQALARKASERKAKFAGRSGYAEGQGGVSGLGSGG